MLRSWKFMHLIILNSLYVSLMYRRTLQYSLILPIWRRMTDILLRTLLKSRMQSSSCTSIRPTAWDKYNSSTIKQIMEGQGYRPLKNY